MSEEFDLIDDFMGTAASAGAAGVFQDQKKVARSYELGKATGVHPGAILGDLEGFEQRLQSSLASDIINGNPQIAAWINGDPMRGGLASGDLANLDFSLGKIGEYKAEAGKRFTRDLVESTVATSLRGWGTATSVRDQFDVNKRTADFIKEGKSTAEAIRLAEEEYKAAKGDRFDDPTQTSLYKMGESVSGAMKETFPDNNLLNPVVSDIIGGFGSLAGSMLTNLVPGVGPFSIVGAGMGEAAEKAVKKGATPEQIARASALGSIAGATDFADALLLYSGGTGKALALLGKVGSRALAGALIEGGQEGLQQYIQNEIAKQVYDPEQARLEDLPYSAFIGAVVGGSARVGLGVHEDWKARREMKAAEPFLNAGEEIPVGLGTATDDFKAKKLGFDLKKLEEAQQAVAQSELREVAPEQFKALLEQDIHLSPIDSIRVSADAILKLYGDKLPTEEDGILGFVPGLKEQLQVGAVAGGDVLIPLADWLTYIDPAVYKELKDDVRTQEHGFTLREVVALKERKKAQPEISEMAELPSKIELKKAQLDKMGRPITAGDPAEIEESYGKGAKEHLFTMHDEKGRTVGDLSLVEYGEGKRLWVGWVGGAERLTQGIMGGTRNDWVLGPHLMLQLAKQVREMFPNAEEVSGYRVSGARDKAGTTRAITRKFDLRFDDAMIDFSGDLFWPKLQDELRRVYGLESPIGGVIEEEGPYEIFTPNKWTPEQAKAIESAAAIIQRVTGDAVELEPVGKMKHESGRGVLGQYIRNEDIPPFIRLAFQTKFDTDVSARHETIHHLRKYGFFTREEWGTIAETAVKEGWVEKNKRLSGKTKEFYEAQGQQELLIEEAIADEFAAWAQKRDQAHPLAKFFQKLWDLLTQIRTAVKEAVGAELSVEELFLATEEGKIGEREKHSPVRLPSGEKPYMGEEFSSAMRIRRLAGERPAETSAQVEAEEPKAPEGVERSVWHGALKNLPKSMMERYMKLMEQRNKEDYEWELEKAQREEKRRQTEEWKYQETLARTQAKDEVENSSGMTLLRMLRDGVYQGERIARPRLDEGALSEEQKKALPKDYYRARGEDPNELAQALGYTDGQRMIEDLVQLENKRGVGRFTNFIEREIEERTDALMKEHFGDLDQNILSETKDRVTGVTQADILYEDLIAMAVLAKAQMPFTQKDVEAWAAAKFGKLSIKLGKRDKYLQEIGRAYKAMEDAFLKGDVQEAFKQSQRRVENHALAEHAKVFERQVVQFDKLAHRFRKREVGKVNQEFTNFVHQLLVKVGYPVQRSVQDIDQEIQKHENTTLDAFVASHKGDGWELQVPQNVAQGLVKPLEQMTIEEWREFKDAVTSLASIGRRVELLEIAGKQYDFVEWRNEVLANIKTLPFRAIEKQMKLLYKIDASLVRIEEVVRDLDLRKELGPLYKGLIEPMMDAKHKSYQLQEELVKRLEAIKKGYGRQWQSRLNDVIEQDFFYDPQYAEHPDAPVLFDLKRSDLLRIAMNWGNESSIKKFVEGYTEKGQEQAFRAKMKNLLDQKLSKEDWQYVQQMLDIFGLWQKDIETMYHNLSGIAPVMVKAQAIQTPHGEFNGGYFPLLRDHHRSDPVKGDDNVNALFGPNYFRSATANFYTRERTGARYAVDFTSPIELVASRMQQTMHDISYRPAVIQANKILNDKTIMKAIRQHYGEEYEQHLKPWLKDIANQHDQNEKKLADINEFLRRMRTGLMVHALGLNLNVLLSPNFGMHLLKTPMIMARGMYDFDGKREFAMEHSKEIPHSFKNLDRDFRESLEKISLEKRWSDYAKTAVTWAFTPIAWADQQYRVETFVQKFRKVKLEGRTDAEASVIADTFVRQHHGSTGLADLPSIMRGPEALKVSTVFYGYFNSMYNWQRQIPNQARAREWKEMSKTIYGAMIVPALVGGALFNKGAEDEPWWKMIAKAFALDWTSKLPFAREAANYALEGYPARSPWATYFTAVGSVATDVKKAIEGKKVEKPIKHTADIIGLNPLMPLPLGQVGKTGQFMYDQAYGPYKKQARDVFEYWRGIRTGEARLKKEGHR